MLRLLPILLLLAGPLLAGGYCGPDASCGLGAVRPESPVLVPPVGGFGTDVIEPSPEARQFYERRMADLWKSEANGTCRGINGAWHLTPRRIFADGVEYEVLAVAGSPERMTLTALRTWDRAPALLTLTPAGRNRLGVTGEVAGEISRFNVALRRC